MSKWISVVPHLDPKYGGISTVVPDLCLAVNSAAEHVTSIVEVRAGASESFGGTSAISMSRIGYRSRFCTHSGDLVERIRSASGLHIHGLWEQSTLLATRAAALAGKPYIVSAHGMLQPWALNSSRWKKVIYGTVIERDNLKRAACLHALTYAEANDYRRYGLTNAIAVIPNGVDLSRHANAEEFLDLFPWLKGSRLVLFLSRLHPKKGLDILCQAWGAVAKDYADAHLVLAGPDFVGTRNQLESSIRAYGLERRVTFTGMLDSRLKWSAYQAAEVFILPSYSEGFSASVLEALASGVPVIISSECHLPEVQKQKCGWVVSPAAIEVEAALREVLETPSATLSEMSQRARMLAQTHFSWEEVGLQMSSLYSWIAGGPKPSRVAIDYGVAA